MSSKFLFLAFVILLGTGLSKKILKKVESQIEETYAVEEFQLEAKIIPANIAKALPSDFGDSNFFEIKAEAKLLGYAYVAQAPSKTANFDYLVLLDTDLTIKIVKVLIYREEYGGEIGSKRWLKQFIGKSEDDNFKYGENIDAISGATISVRNMTHAMNELMKSLKIIKTKNIL